jgi:hypothetical protein
MHWMHVCAGTNTSAEGKKYFSDLKKHRIVLEYKGKKVYRSAKIEAPIKPNARESTNDLFERVILKRHLVFERPNGAGR